MRRIGTALLLAATAAAGARAGAPGTCTVDLDVAVRAVDRALARQEPGAAVTLAEAALARCPGTALFHVEHGAIVGA